MYQKIAITDLPVKVQRIVFTRLQEMVRNIHPMSRPVEAFGQKWVVYWKKGRFDKSGPKYSHALP